METTKLTKVSDWLRKAADEMRAKDVNGWPVTADAARELLEQCQEFVTFVRDAPVSSGVCCCGESMVGHSDPMSCGHTPVDQWDYSLSLWLKEPALRSIIDGTATEQAKLTKVQVEMLAACIEQNAAWTTVRAGENFDLLLRWQDAGYCKEVPSLAPSFASFIFTDAGRLALQQSGGSE